MDDFWCWEHSGLPYSTGRASLMSGGLKQVAAGMQLNDSVQDGPLTSETSQGLTLSFTKYGCRVDVEVCSVSNV